MRTYPPKKKTKNKNNHVGIFDSNNASELPRYMLKIFLGYYFAFKYRFMKCFLVQILKVCVFFRCTGVKNVHLRRREGSTSGENIQVVN